MHFHSWLQGLFVGKTTRVFQSGKKRRRVLRPILERLEDRLAPALITIDTAALTLSDSYFDSSSTPYTAHLADNGQVAEFDFAGHFGLSATDTLRVVGDATRAVRLVVAGDASIAGTIEASASISVTWQVSGAVDFAGPIDLEGTLTVNAASLEVSGDITASHITFTSEGLLNISATGAVVVANGGALTIDGRTVINSGELHADGPDGGQIQVFAAKVQNSGDMTADGLSGHGGTIAVSFSGSYVETQSGLLSAEGNTGAGGSITINGGLGSLFTSGRHEARGADGGQVHLLAGQIHAVAAAEDVSATTGVAGQISIIAATDADYSGTLTSRGVTSGGQIEVSAGGTLTYAGVADADATTGTAGTLLLDPKNLIISASSGSLPQYNFIDPNPGSGSSYGATVLTLSTGNVLVADPTDNFGGTNAGAVYLFNGLTGALISSLVGANDNDLIGQVDGYFLYSKNGLVALSNGNFIVDSPSWGGGKGAVTWGNGTVGVSGTVSSSNSLVGSSSSDAVGLRGGPYPTLGVTELSNGNYLVESTSWNGSRGAVTWGSGTAGVHGLVSPANSLVGSNVNDAIGVRGVIPLNNGNYVVDSAYWNGNRGAVTWGNGVTGVSGVVSSANSLVGSTSEDYVGLSVTALTNGNYIVGSESWNGTRGAVTWADGSSGRIGTVSTSNSLVGSNAGDYVGHIVTALTNGNYVVGSWFWNGNRGAATWANGSMSLVGTVSSSNSLVGSNAADYVGENVTALTNGNYVVGSASWNGYRGAATWGNGSTGITGTVSSGNSLVGSNISGFGDNVGGHVVALTNGNYVVASAAWNGNRGAATWGNGNTGISGTISSTTSLVGATAGDWVGDSVTALTNGNYVVTTGSWNGNRGAATWGNGGGGITGTVSSSNSLVGTTSGDWVGNSVTALANGNYVVGSGAWNGYRGAATWGNGSLGISGPVSSSNSLVGPTAGDYVGHSVTPLTNGNYVVASKNWNGNRGAVTWVNGSTGITGAVTSANSLVGTTPGGDDYSLSPGDLVGADLTELSDGNYVIQSPFWHTGAGAVSWMDGTSGRALDGSNNINAQNSLIGQQINTGLITEFGVPEDTVNHTFLASFTTEGYGRVTAGLVDPNLLTFQLAANSSTSVIRITPGLLTRTLNTGTNVVLQADNDITINSPITVSNPSGNGGSLTLDAGRSILFGPNAGITTDNGNLTLIANETPANGVVSAFRDSGYASITVPTTSPLNVGTGILTVIMGQGGAINTAGTVSLAGAITAAATIYSTTTTLQDSGPNPSTAGQSVNFSVTVTPCAGSAIDGETVSIQDASNNYAVVATATVSNGTALFSLAALPAGTHNLIAVYGGDSTHIPSQSSVVSQNINHDTVLTSPSNQSVNAGAFATFVTLSALPSVDAVQWQVSTDGGQTWQPSNSAGLPDTVINSATTTTLSFSATASRNGFQYRAAFTNPAYPSNNPLLSTAATLTVQDAVIIQPAPVQAALLGQSVTLTAASGYASDLVYWQVSSDLGGSWTDLIGATTTTLTLNNLTAIQDGNEYRAVFVPLVTTPTNPANTTTLNGQTVLLTNPAFLVVDGIIEQPSNQNFGQTVVFTARSARLSDTIQWKISTDGGQSYQPLDDSGPYSGSQSSTLTISGTTLDMLGNEYVAVFTNSKLTLTTVPVTLVPAELWDADPAANNIRQGAVTGQPIGLTATTDLNNGAGLTYHLSVDAGGRFAIAPTTGVVTVANGSAINVLDDSYVIQVTATDTAGDTAVGNFTIGVTGSPPISPVDHDSNPNSVVAQAGVGTPVGITAFAGSTNPVTYRLSDDADGRFAIDPQTGRVTVADGTQLHYPDIHTITVVASDPTGGTSSASFTIRVNSDDPAALTIGGYSLLNAVINGTNISGAVSLPIVGVLSLNGTVQAGQYELRTSSVSSLSFNGLTLHNAVFTLTNNGLTLAGRFENLPVLGSVDVLGTIAGPGDFELGIVAPLPSIGGFSSTAASIIPGSPGFGLKASVTLPHIGTVDLSGTIQSLNDFSLTATRPSITLDQTLLADTIITLNASGLRISGTASLPLVGTVPLSGSLQNGQYTFGASLPKVAVGGYTLSAVALTLDNGGLSLTANANLPLVNGGNPLSLTGRIQDSAHFSFSANVPDLSLAGFTVSHAVVTLDATGVVFAGTATLPLVNGVNLSGSITAAGSCTLTANVPDLSLIGGFQFSDAKVTLTNSSLGLSGVADLPFLGKQTMTGLISDASHYSVSFSPPELTFGSGFSLSSDVRITLSAAGLTVVGDANLPVLNSISHLQGTIQDATHFNLSAPLPSLGIGQFSLSNATVTLSGSGGAVALGVSGTVHLPLFSDVQFTGTIDGAGNLSLSTQMPTFSLPGGFIEIANGTLTLFTDHVHVEADLTVAQIGNAHFVGDILPSGDYELDASASLTIGGFTIPAPSLDGPNLKLINGELDIGFDYNIPGLEAFLPPGEGGVSFSGTYSLNGDWSLTATASYTINIGPVVITSESLTLTNTSLTLSAHGSVADLGPLAEGDVSMTIYKDGSFQAMVTVDSTVAGFSLGHAIVTFGNHNDTKLLIATLHGAITVPTMLPNNVTVDGYWDSNGNYDFMGTADAVLGGLTLAQAQLRVSKSDGLTFSAACDFGVLDATVSGTITPDSDGGFTTTSDVVGTILGGPHLDLHGSFDSHGNYDFKGKLDVVFGPLTLSECSFELNNETGLTFSDSWNYGLYTATVTGTIQAEGAGFLVIADAHGTIWGQPLELQGEIHGNRQFELTGNATVGLSLVGTSATFSLSNKTGSTVFMFTTGWSFGPFTAATLNGTIVANTQDYVVAFDAQGSIFGESLKLRGDLNSSGKFDLQGIAKVGLQPLSGITTTFYLSNKTGNTVFKFSGDWDFNPFSAATMTGTITGSLQNYSVAIDADGSIFGQTLELVGDIKSTGNFYLAGSAKVGLSPLLGTTATFELSNNTGATVFMFSGGWNSSVFAAATMTGTITRTQLGYEVAVKATGSVFGETLTLSGNIYSGGYFDLQGDADVGITPFTGMSAHFDLSNATGSTVFKFTGSWTLGVFSAVSASGTIIGGASNYVVSVSATGTLLGNTVHFKGIVLSSGYVWLYASDNVNFFGVSLTSVSISYISGQGFTLYARWSHPLFAGNVSGSIGTDGHVQLHGTGHPSLAGFYLNVSADLNLDPAHSSFSAHLHSDLDVYVATVGFDARADWSSGSLPHLTFTGRASTGGILSELLSGDADFILGSNVVGFSGTLHIPRVPSATFYVNASIDGDGNLGGIPAIWNVFSLDYLWKYAATVWRGLGAGWSNIALGLNREFGFSGQNVANLLRGANATAGELSGALSSAFHWSESQVSNFLGGGGGIVSSIGSGVEDIAGSLGVSWGIPEGSLVFFDGNKNSQLDLNEPWGYTTAQGHISFQVPVTFDTNINGVLDDTEGQWVVQGGIDLTTGLPPAFDSVTPASWEIASPLTTLVSVLVGNNSLTLSQASAQLLFALNLPAEIDLSTFDTVAAALAGTPHGRLVETVHTQVEITVGLIAALFRSPYNAPPSSSLTNQIIGDLASFIAQAATPVDLSSPAILASLIQAAETTTGITLDGNLVAGSVTVIAGCNQQLNAIGSTTGLQYLEAVAQVKTIALSKVASDLASAAAGQISINTVVADDSGAPLAAAIAAAATPPYLLVPINIVAPAESPNGAVVDFTLLAFDLAGQPLTPTSNFVSGTIFPMGVTTVTAQAIDALGNTITSTFTITVADTTSPSINLPANLTVEANVTGGANVVLPQATANDTVDANPTVSENLSSGFFPLGTTPVVVTATDSVGNTTTNIFTVTVVDHTAPTLTLPDNFSVEANIGGGAQVNLPQSNATDAADSNPFVTFDQPSGFFPLGTTVVHVTAIDASGNTSNGSFTVTVVDTTAPALSLPADLVVEANAIGGANVIIPDVFAIDAADIAPVVITDHPSGYFGLGTTAVHVTVTDAAGNISTGSYTVTVADTTPPVISLPEHLTIQANTTGGAFVTLPVTTASDANDPNPTVTADQVSGFFPLGTTTVIVTASDAFGNSSSDSYTVTVINEVAPVFVMPSAQQLRLRGNHSDALASQSNMSDPLASYDMIVEANTRDGAFVTLPTLTAIGLADAAPLVRLDHASGFFPLGTTVINATASDSSGNVTTGSFTVTVIDSMPPILTVPVKLEIEATIPGGGALVDLPLVQVADIADPNPIITYSHLSGFFPMGATTVHVTAQDGSGNASAADFIVTVVDTTPPSVTPPANVVVQASSLAGAQIVLPTASATDLVDANPVLSYDHPSGWFPIGTSLVRVRATDTAGNTALATFSVTVNQIPTTTTVHADGPGASTYGEVLTFTVEVSAVGGAVIPDGEMVNLVDATHSNIVVGTGVIENGSATVTLTNLNAGSHSLVAVYPGSNATAGSQSDAVNQLVHPRQLLIKAVTNFKSYDGTTSAAALPVVIGLQASDNVSGLSEYYLDAGIGFDKTLVPTGTVNDGNGGNNYVVSFGSNVTGTISISLNSPLSPSPNAQPTFTGIPGTADGDSGTVTVNIYAGTLVGGQRFDTLETTVVGSSYSVQMSPAFTVDGIYTAQSLQSSGSGRIYSSTPVTFIIDWTPPVVSTPPFQSMSAITSAGVTDSAAFTATATDTFTLSPTITYMVESNVITADYVFSLGMTTVTVIAVDAAGNQSRDTFVVSVVSSVPTEATFNAGTTAALHAVPPSLDDMIQWQVSLDGVHFTDIAGENNSTYEFATIRSQNGNFYRTLFSNSSQTTSSIPIELFVIEHPEVLDAVFTLPENSSTGTIAGTVIGSEPGDTLQYSIIDGNALGAFAINRDTGKISVVNTALLDFETHPVWPLIVQVTDSHGQTDTATVTINLVDMNDAPSVVDWQFALLADSPVNTIVGTVQGSDQDLSDTLTYSITDGNSLGAFAINPQTGVITVADSSQLDLNTHPTWNLTVQVMDSEGATGTGTVTITLTSLNHSPQLNLNGSSVTFSAKAAKKGGPILVVPYLTVVDPDLSPAFRIGGGTLKVSIDVAAKVSKKGKVTMYDQVGGLGSATSLGTTTGAIFSNGKLAMTVELNDSTTTSAIQSFLRGLSFTTKGAGVKQSRRVLQAQVSDADRAFSNLLQQTVNVTK